MLTEKKSREITSRNCTLGGDKQKGISLERIRRDRAIERL